LLHEAGQEVVLIDPWREHIERIQAEGLRLLRDSEEQILRVEASTSPQGVGPVGLVLLLVKAYHTEEAVAGALSLFGERTSILSLQNGLGNGEKICRHIPRERVLLGITNQGAYLVAPGVIRHAGVGETQLGPLEPSSIEGAREVVEAFNSAGIKTSLASDLEAIIWGKLLVNVGINPIAALADRRNGELLEIPELSRLMELAVAEAVEVARRKGITLPYTDPLGRVREAARASASNKCSMLQDLERGRRTEIEVLNGAVVTLARDLGIPAPVNEALTALVKARERVVHGGESVEGKSNVAVHLRRPPESP